MWKQEGLGTPLSCKVYDGSGKLAGVKGWERGKEFAGKQILCWGRCSKVDRECLASSVFVSEGEEVDRKLDRCIIKPGGGCNQNDVRAETLA